jgi:hypothetical protein
MAQGMENPAPNNWWEWLLSNASQLRDLALFTVAATYTLAFIIWSVHTLRNDLGLLPAIDLQYIIAGLGPLTLLGVVMALMYFVARTLSRNTLVAGWLRNFIYFCMLLFNAILFYALYNIFVLDVWPNLVPLVLAVLIISSSALTYMLTYTGNVGIITGTGYLTFFTIILIISYYTLEIYPIIPQAFGGAKPRCAQLDVDMSKISTDFRSALFSADVDTSTIRRSDAVDVYYVGDNWILVKRAPSTETYEIDRDVITSITWC